MCFIISIVWYNDGKVVFKMFKNHVFWIIFSLKPIDRWWISLKTSKSNSIWNRSRYRSCSFWNWLKLCLWACSRLRLLRKFQTFESLSDNLNKASAWRPSEPSYWQIFSDSIWSIRLQTQVILRVFGIFGFFRAFEDFSRVFWDFRQTLQEFS